MARFTKSRVEQASSVSTSPVLTVVAAPSGPISHSPLPRPAPNMAERYDRLAALTIRVPDAAVGRLAIRDAARLRCMLPELAHKTEVSRTRAVARFIALEAITHGGQVAPRAAFKRQAVDRYIGQVGLSSERGLRELRTVLYETGRLLHPREYPAARVLPAPRFKREPAATAEQVRYWQSLVGGVPTALGQQLQTLLDLCLGVGARPSDLRHLRGRDIQQIPVRGTGQVTAVTLPNLSGGSRVIPVFDPAIARRLRLRAAYVGPEHLLLTGGLVGERNLANRTSERLKRHGYETVSCSALRGRWILTLSDSVPAALLMQLADLVDIRVLADQRDRLRRYDLAEAAVLTSEVRY
ncbi:MAG: hypothetical protein QM774_11140 [Gordonia sp. (in: high G+C Gram-positive bacteria)]|uniref:hypothetical protein n=1 Tax=Gordonia sp. (in: high G+C Gram-positive bacteria) TaxID=84139 RepID=UPI0039E41630